MRKIILSLLLLGFLQPHRILADDKAADDTATWTQSGTLPLSFVAAKNRVRAKMTAAGYTEKHEIKMGKKEDRSLILWEKDSEKIIYMLWKIDIGKTGYSWGEWNAES